MTFHSLFCHAASPPPAGLGVSARGRRAADGSLRLTYRLHGDSARLLLPARQAARPVDGLWQHTCCEAFIAAVDAVAYHEFNFSPSTCWAAYRFLAYRQPDPDWRCPLPPSVGLVRDAGGCRLEAVLPAALLPPGDDLRISLTAVLESRDGQKSYWALRHAAPQPDFHLRSSFVLPLPTP